jgi:hypothetical protein
VYLLVALFSFSAAYALWTHQRWAGRALLTVSFTMIALAMVSLIQLVGGIFSDLAYSVLPNALLANLIIAMSVFLVAVAIFLSYLARSTEIAALYGQRADSAGYSRHVGLTADAAAGTRSLTARYLISVVGSDGSIERRQVSAAQPTCIVGRSSERADLRLSDETVSRLHAKFELVGDALMVSDLGPVFS